MLRFLPAKAIEPSHIFMIFYAVALLADFDNQFAQEWGWLIAALSIWVVLSPSRLSFLALLGASTLYFVLNELPDTENHTNLLVFTNLSMMLCLLYSYALQRPDGSEAFYEVAQPVARLSIIAALAVAGFHKFNYDFINPSVSCVRDFASGIAFVATGDFLGIGVPPLAFLGLMAVTVGLFLWRQRPNLCWPRIDWAGVTTPVAAILLGMIVLSAVSGEARSYQPYDLFVFFLAVAVLVWQLIEAPLLLAPRFQWVALCFSMLIHAQLAFLRIVDFQAIAIALLITFVPRDIWQVWSRRSLASFGKIRIHRARLYFLLNLIGALLIMAELYRMIDIPRPHTAWGLLFIAGLLVMLWPIISDLFSPERSWRWEGVPVLEGATPRWLYVMPVCLLLFGLTSYFGLRTAGNLSMYSNLRTEAGRNNHLVLGRNQLKWASYQDDVVRIVYIGRPGMTVYLDRGGRLDGNLLPLVEFRKLLLKWRKRGWVVPMRVEYKGVLTESDNIAKHPDWQVDDWDWEMRLMDFRVIQSSAGPNTCRW